MKIKTISKFKLMKTHPVLV